MSFEDPWLREGKISPLEWERCRYQQTKNPLHAWRALQICVELMREGVYRCETLPPWLLEYVDMCVSNVQEAFGNDPDSGDVPALIAAAFGFKRLGQGVRGDAFTDYIRSYRYRSLAIQARRQIRLHPRESIDAIVTAVAEAQQVSKETMYRALSEWNALLDEAFDD